MENHNSKNNSYKKSFMRIFSIVMSLLIMAGMFAVPVSATTVATEYCIEELDGLYKTQGRTAVVDGALRLDWSASGMIFKADCSGDVKITVVPTRINTSADYGDYFTVYVDGVMQYENLRIPENNSTANWTSNSTGYPFHITKTGETTYTIASNLPAGEHTFEIYHQNEAANARFGIKSVTLNGTFLAPPKDNDLYIEVIGDSISASFGNISIEDNRAPLYQDSTRGWPFMTARALNADWSVIGRSGITATKGIGFSGAESISMQDIYPYLRYYSDTETKYDFARQPDVIVVCLGTNDMATYNDIAGNTVDVVKKGFADLLTMLREYNPNSKIVWIYGMMTANANTHIKEALSNAGGVEKGFYGFELPAEPTARHPKLSTQYRYTALLADYIENVVLDPNYKENYATEKTDVTIYRATDAADNMNGAYYSDKDAVWKFAVSGFGEIFRAATEDFAAPTAEVLPSGDLKLSWEVPENTSGRTTVKIIGDNYNKEIIVAKNSIVLKELPLRSTYNIQITVGDISSKVLTYSHIYSPISITDYLHNEKTIVTSKSDRLYDTMFVDVSDYTDYINPNSGILIKVGTKFISDNNVISYYDAHTDIKADVSCDSENAAMDKMSMQSGDVGLSFQTMFYLPTVNPNGSFSSGKLATANADATRGSTYFDINGGTLLTSNSVNLVTNGDHMKFQDFTGGYIFIPFDMIDSDSIASVKNSGAVNLVVQRHKYFAKNYFQNNNTWTWNVLNWEETDYDTDTTGTIGYWFDREVHFEEAKFIADYDAFLSSCVDQDNLTAGVDYKKLSSVSGGVSDIYLDNVEVMTASSGTDYKLTSNTANSSYLVDNSTNYLNKIIYTTAAGEKMKLGFTAPKSGLYEISAPIEADTEKGIHYRLTKKTAKGVINILQSEKVYSGEEYFTLMNAGLNKGDTVYLEAWSDSPGTAICLGIPQFIHLNNGSTENSIVYKANDHIAINSMNDFGSASVWKFGTFVNPFVADGTEYRYLNATDFANVTEFDYDVLGINELSVTDIAETATDETDASALINSFVPYDAIATYSDSHTDIFYQSKENGLGYKNSAYNTQKPYRYAWTGQLKADKRKYNDNVYIRYGLATAAGGGQKNVYINFGHYQQFVSPADGKVILDLGTAANPGKVIVLHNTKVIATYLGGALPGTDGAVTVNVAESDTVSIAYATVYDPENGLEITDTGNVQINPTATFTPDTTEESVVSFDSEIPVVMSEKIENGTVITIPTTSKAGGIFRGWTANGKVYNSGESYTVSENIAFKADYIYYGDLDGSGEDVNAYDLAVMRKILLGITDAGACSYADITADLNADSKINLTDLIRLKKYIADIPVTIGA